MRTATFENSVSVLVKAYFQGTLKHGSCTACAVGNLVADSMSYIIPKFRSEAWVGGVFPMWDAVFCTCPYSLNQRINPQYYQGPAKTQIDSTGYSYEDLARIEFAFESAHCSQRASTGKADLDSEEYMFNGLMAVVDILAEIHNVDLSTKESAKLLFVNP